MNDLLRIHDEAACTHIALDDGKANALSPAMLAALETALDGAVVRQLPVVLTGRDGIFSAGFDLKVMTGGDGESRNRMVFAGFEVAYRLLSLPLPVVIGCTGHAIAMGVFLLMAGDVRVGAAGDFRIGANETALGIVMPEFAIEITRQRLHPSAHDRALITSEFFAPEAACAAGFLDEIVPAADVVDRAREVAARLAEYDLGVYAETKRRVRAGSLAALRAAIDTDAAGRLGA